VPDSATVLYDRDCGFCRWTLAQLLRWDRAKRLRPVAIQSEEGQRLLAGVPEAKRLESWHLVEPDGTVRSAEAGFPGLFGRLPAGAPVALLTRLLQGPSGAGYRLLVANRTRLGRRIGAERRDEATAALEAHARAAQAAARSQGGGAARTGRG
jgi:predicted DCC family thiol-disulfide oxidoreductase YuxK